MYNFKKNCGPYIFAKKGKSVKKSIPMISTACIIHSPRVSVQIYLNLTGCCFPLIGLEINGLW
jgi:hypothetical protein